MKNHLEQSIDDLHKKVNQIEDQSERAQLLLATITARATLEAGDFVTGDMILSQIHDRVLFLTLENYDCTN